MLPYPQNLKRKHKYGPNHLEYQADGKTYNFKREQQKPNNRENKDQQ